MFKHRGATLIPRSGLKQPVIAQHRGEGEVRKLPGLKYERLAASPNHSLIRGFDLIIETSPASPAARALLQLSVHQFFYNYGETSCVLKIGLADNVDHDLTTRSAGFLSPSEMVLEGADGESLPGMWKDLIVNPGDSLYIQPNVRHQFLGMGGEEARLYVVRIPGNLTRELMMEVSLCDPRGKQRIGNENKRWYN